MGEKFVLASRKKTVKNEGDEQMLSEILKELSGSSGRKTCFCSYPVFQAVYHAAGQGDRPGYLMLCSLVDKDGRQIHERDILAEASEHLAKAIEADIPGWGVVCRYDVDLYLLLLVGTGKEECGEVGRRIEASFLKSFPGAGIRWEMNRVASKNGKQKREQRVHGREEIYEKYI